VKSGFATFDGGAATAWVTTARSNDAIRVA
jgi:hypothetical protein